MVGGSRRFDLSILFGLTMFTMDYRNIQELSIGDEFFFPPSRTAIMHWPAQAVLPHPEQLVLQGFAEGELVLWL